MILQEPASCLAVWEASSSREVSAWQLSEAGWDELRFMCRGCPGRRRRTAGNGPHGCWDAYGVWAGTASRVAGDGVEGAEGAEGATG